MTGGDFGAQKGKTPLTVTAAEREKITKPEEQVYGGKQQKKGSFPKAYRDQGEKNVAHRPRKSDDQLFPREKGTLGKESEPHSVGTEPRASRAEQDEGKHMSPFVKNEGSEKEK